MKMYYMYMNKCHKLMFKDNVKSKISHTQCYTYVLLFLLLYLPRLIVALLYARAALMSCSQNRLKSGLEVYGAATSLI